MAEIKDEDLVGKTINNLTILTVTKNVGKNGKTLESVCNCGKKHN